jgi:DNA invertase Pin-like site-specific DNA recombinase
MPLGAVLYVRCSTRDQSDNGVTLEAQREACERKAALLNLTILGSFEDAGYSGRKDIEDRPGLAKAIEAVQGSEAVVGSGNSARSFPDILPGWGSA